MPHESHASHAQTPQTDPALLAADLLRWPDALRPENKTAFVGKVALGVGLGLAATPFILPSIHTTDYLGPHRIVVTTTTDGAATLDLGFIGSARLSIDAPLNLGVSIDVKETKKTDKALIDDYQRLALIMQYPKGEEAHLKEIVMHQIGESAAIGLLGGELAVFAAASACRRKFRSNDSRLWFDKNSVTRIAAAGVICAPFIAGITHANENIYPDSWQSIASIIGPRDAKILPPKLRALEVRGSELGAAIPGGWKLVKEKFIDSKKFYGTLEKEFAAQTIAPKEPNEVRIITVSDRHDNIAMDSLIRIALQKTDADILIDLGDDTSSGASAESLSIDNLIAETKGVKDRYFVSGNHDSALTTAQLKKHGFNELTIDRPITVHGVRLLGGPDPRHSDLGMAIKQGDKSVPELGKNLAKAACSDADGIDMLVTHDPEAGNETAVQGCAQITAAGHMHYQKDPVLQVNADGTTVYRFINGTTGGAESALSIGPLSAKADITMLSFIVDEGKQTYFNGSQNYHFTKSGRVEVKDFRRAIPTALRPDRSTAHSEPEMYNGRARIVTTKTSPVGNRR